MAISVKLEKFEGPLDLLLHLIEKNKVSIYDIPIVEITDQYMEYVSQLSSQSLDVMSEFLVMAATLLDIKSRMLLPPEVSEEGEEIDPRQELVDQLVEYKMYKYISDELRGCMKDAMGHYYKDPTIPEEVAEYKEPADVDTLLSDVTLQNLYTLFQDLMRRQEDRVDTVHAKFGTLKKEAVSLSETLQFVGDYIFKKKNCTFGELLRQRPGKQNKIAAFLSLLELMKEGKVKVRQPETFSDISLRWAGGKEREDLNLTGLAADYE